MEPLQIIIGVFLFFLALLWFLLPFAVFGVKDRLDVLISEQKNTNALLREIRNDFEKQENQ